MDGGKCIFQLRGSAHSCQINLISPSTRTISSWRSYDKKNLFDVEKYMKRVGKAKVTANTD